MHIEYFAVPFKIGLAYLLIIVTVRFIKLTLGLSKIDKIRIWKSVLTNKSLISIREAFMEGLLHRKIFRINPVLGYMHMSLAFGWFLLIVMGHIETVVHTKSMAFPFHMPIFYRHFVNGDKEAYLSGVFPFMMDLILLFVLSGVALAFLKRLRSRYFGMKKTTSLKSGDRIALISLWLIFPLRFIAESFSAGIYYNGSFLTQAAGNFFNSFLPLKELELPLWWAYSISLGLFFIALPNSRYMHIPAEILFIFLRNFGIRLKKRYNTYSLVQVYSCSRCGICLDTCQLNDANIRNTQSVYVLKNIRNRNLTDETLFNCLLCGRCQQICPVAIELNDLRITQRIESTRQYNSSYEYLKEGEIQKADVIYFAGCMTHLTPSIKKSMTDILTYAGINYWFMDEEKAPCCGRPLMQAGQFDAAQKLILNNQQLIVLSGAKQLVVSCPICYKVFKEDYVLHDIEVKHHSEFLLELTEKNIIKPQRIPKRIIYHDPCELGRGSGIYEKPRELLAKYVDLIKIKNERENSFCCGGSLANIKIQMQERDKIRDRALDEYMKYKPDFLVTSCPLCKKTFSKGIDIQVHDIAEIVAESLKVGRRNVKYAEQGQEVPLQTELI
jgi:Fe-S oxidoreductase